MQSTHVVTCASDGTAPACGNMLSRLSVDGMHVAMQEVGFCHMRISDGVNSRLQLSGLLAKLCKVTLKSQ